MNPEEKKLLEHIAKLSEKNNKLLKKMRTSMRIGAIIKIAYWTIIISTAIGAFYYFQPIIDDYTSLYGNIRSNFGSLSHFFTAEDSSTSTMK